MRAFVVLCLIALACADVSHLSGGYDYPSSVYLPGGVNGGSGGSGGLGGSGGSGGFGGSGGSGGFGGVGGSSGGLSGDGGFGGNSGGGNGELEKEFYTFTADEADFDDHDNKNAVSDSLKKNLRVIFIKGPENKGLENAALNLAKSAGDQRTAIYVLNKQTDLGDLAHKLSNEHNQNLHKPEVHFVKYRTPEDAHNAQHQIQSQYDHLGGSSQSHDGGVAPVLDFASKATHHSGNAGHDAGFGNNGYSHPHPHSHPGNTYVPPAAPSRAYLTPSLF